MSIVFNLFMFICDWFKAFFKKFTMSNKKDEDEDQPKFKTVLSDSRFYNCNHATQWCFTSYVDYFKCQRLLGKE